MAESLRMFTEVTTVAQEAHKQIGNMLLRYFIKAVLFLPSEQHVHQHQNMKNFGVLWDGSLGLV